MSKVTSLKFNKKYPEIYESLGNIKRTGWVMRGVQNPETVKEHTESLIALALELGPTLAGEEKDGLVDMLEVHDWPEILSGDKVILESNPAEYERTKKDQFEKEGKALDYICKDLQDGEEITNLWIRFEKSDDPAASFARQLDKYQAIEKAVEYEKEQGIELLEEFLTYSVNLISHPVLLEKIDKLKSM